MAFWTALAEESSGVTSKRRVAQLSSLQKTTKDFVPEGLDERSLAVYCLETVRKSVPSRQGTV
jgi:hypothetical protein